MNEQSERPVPEVFGKANLPAVGFENTCMSRLEVEGK